ncbi:MAG: hypothetical protein GQ527_07125 [Bacteroidales bacterium]|nr:hypothetical protein [Bacteroidales bacterium]
MLKISKLFIYGLFLFSMVMMLNSCATVFDRKNNTISVEAGSPVDAEVFLDGELLGEAPFKQRISKYKLQEGSILEIKKEGFETLVFEVKRSPHIGYVAMDILGGVIPLIIDVADGNIYRPNTRKIEYELVKLNADGKNTIEKHQKDQERR